MADARHDMGLVSTVKAEALGVPGQRRFRLMLEGPGGNACLWLEKSQLFQLSLVIRQMLAMLTSEELSEEDVQSSPDPVGENSSMEFEVGNLSVGHDPQRKLFVIEVHRREDEEDVEAHLGFWASRTQLEGLAEEAQAVCAAGRPLCPLCGAPMGPEAHICPRSNGHRSH